MGQSKVDVRNSIMNKGANIMTLYRIENPNSEHFDVLSSVLKDWLEMPPDLCIVSEEGAHIYTQKILLCFYSKYFSNLVATNADETICINIGASSKNLAMMLKILTEGAIVTNNKESLFEVVQTAAEFRIDIDGKQIQIGLRKQNVKIKPLSPKKELNVIVNGEEVPLSSNIVLNHEPSQIEIEEVQSSTSGLYEEEIPDKETLTNRNKMTLPKRKEKNVKSDLNVDVKSEENKGSTVCDVCQRSFSMTSSLINHRLIHSGERFKCEFCDYSAVQKGNLKTHRIRHHKDQI